MKGFLQEYGIIMVVVSVVLGMLTFSKTGYASGIQDGILGGANHILKVGQNITKDDVEPSSMLITSYSGESTDTFNSKIPESATVVAFTNEKAPKGVEITSLSQEGDVVGWLDGTTWKVSTQDTKKRFFLIQI